MVDDMMTPHEVALQAETRMLHKALDVQCDFVDTINVKYGELLKKCERQQKHLDEFVYVEDHPYEYLTHEQAEELRKKCEQQEFECGRALKLLKEALPYINKFAFSLLDRINFALEEQGND